MVNLFLLGHVTFTRQKSGESATGIDTEINDDNSKFDRKGETGQILQVFSTIFIEPQGGGNPWATPSK